MSPLPKPPPKPVSPAELRLRAESNLSQRRSIGDAEALPSPDDALRMLHELEVRQIELEMQNEELQRSHVQLELSLKRYAELYDSLPVGLFTVARDGTIARMNLAGASILGAERGELIGRHFASFVAQSDPHRSRAPSPGPLPTAPQPVAA